MRSAARSRIEPRWRASELKEFIHRCPRAGFRRQPFCVVVHGAPLSAPEIILIDNVPVTSLARTVLDLARTLPMTQAVAAGDRALALGLRREDLDIGLAAMERWPSIRAELGVIHVSAQ